MYVDRDFACAENVACVSALRVALSSSTFGYLKLLNGVLVFGLETGELVLEVAASQLLSLESLLELLKLGVKALLHQRVTG